MAPSMNLLDRMKRNPAGDWTIADVETLCGEYDVTCTAPSGGGSHYKISDPSVPDLLTIPYRRPVKPVYIRLPVRLIGTVLAARGATR